MHTNPPNAREFAYRASWAGMLLAVLFCAAGGAFMSWKAATNQKGLSISGLITMSPAGATVFFWVMAGLCFVFIPVFLAMMVVMARGGQRVTLAREGLSVPVHRLSRRERLIPYDQITDISIFSLGKGEFLRIQWKTGKFDFTISMFESRAAVDELVALLRERCDYGR